MKSTLIRVTIETLQKLDQLKHPGQTYDGVIRELLENIGRKDASSQKTTTRGN